MPEVELFLYILLLFRARGATLLYSTPVPTETTTSRLPVLIVRFHHRRWARYIGPYGTRLESSVSISFTSCCARARSPAKIRPMGFFAMRQIILVPSCFKTASLSAMHALTL